MKVLFDNQYEKGSVLRDVGSARDFNRNYGISTLIRSAESGEISDVKVYPKADELAYWIDTAIKEAREAESRALGAAAQAGFALKNLRRIRAAMRGEQDLLARLEAYEEEETD